MLRITMAIWGRAACSAAEPLGMLNVEAPTVVADVQQQMILLLFHAEADVRRARRERESKCRPDMVTSPGVCEWTSIRGDVPELPSDNPSSNHSARPARFETGSTGHSLCHRREPRATARDVCWSPSGI